MSSVAIGIVCGLLTGIWACLFAIMSRLRGIADHLKTIASNTTRRGQ